MRIDFNISQTERGKFRTACEAVVRNIGTGTKSATEYAAWDIMSDSLGQVPVDTGTLISSAYFGVSRRSDVSGYRYGAVLGYGTPEGLDVGAGLNAIEWLRAPSNNVNPKNGHQASTYAGRVHEDLDMPHPNGGKAKFLEDPVRNWASGKYSRTLVTYWKNVIEYHNSSVLSTKYIKNDDFFNVFGYSKPTAALIDSYIKQGKLKAYSSINWAYKSSNYKRVQLPETIKVSRTTLRSYKTRVQRGGKRVRGGQD